MQTVKRINILTLNPATCASGVSTPRPDRVVTMMRAVPSVGGLLGVEVGVEDAGRSSALETLSLREGAQVPESHPRATPPSQEGRDGADGNALLSTPCLLWGWC